MHVLCNVVSQYAWDNWVPVKHRNNIAFIFFQVRVTLAAGAAVKAYRVLWDSVTQQFEVKLLDLQINYAQQMCTKYQNAAKHAFDNLN